ncbi:MAG: sugar phosphate nucleotidyltransferase [Acidimicrobiales bacterium]
MSPPGAPGRLVSTDVTLVLLAAGMGSRFGGLKQLAPVGPNGEAIFDYTVRDAQAAGVDRVVLIVRDEIREAISDHVARRWPGDLEIEWVLQQTPAGRAKPLGTAHAVLATRPTVGGPFLVLNADDHYGSECFPEIVAHLTTTSEHVLAGFRVDRTLLGPAPVNRGRVWAEADGAVTGVAEGRVEVGSGGALTWTGQGRVDHLRGDEPVSMNLWGFQPSLFDWLQRAWEDFGARHLDRTDAELLLPTVVDAMLTSGLETVRLLPTEAWCLGVTHADDLPLIQAVAANGWERP